MPILRILLQNILLTALLCGACGAVAAPAFAETILFIGNSFTAGNLSPVEHYRPDSVSDLGGSGIGGVPALFKSFADQTGLHYEVSHELAGGMNLDYHFEQKGSLIARPWDHVILQPYSTLDKGAPGNAAVLIDYAARLALLLQSANPPVDIRLMATWSRADQTYLSSGHWYGQEIEAMALELRGACDRAVLASPGIRAVIPVGQAWNLAISSGVAVRNPYLEPPSDQTNLWAADQYHASAAGYYLEALVVFGSVTGHDPRTLGPQEAAAAELGILPAIAQTLQRLAYETLLREPPLHVVSTATSAPAVAEPTGALVGVVADPCVNVPVQPTAVHKQAANVYESWIRDWLHLDWGQHCQYRAENATLAAASKDRIVYLGDSITEGWKILDPTFFNDQILDRGISGQTTAQMLVRFRSDVLDLHPALIHIMAGTNDIAGNTGPTTLADIEGNLATMVELARAHDIDVVLASIPPAAAYWWRPGLLPAAAIASLNDWLQRYAATHHLVYADYYSAMKDPNGALRSELADDGVHPNAAGYALMRPIAERAVARALKLRRASVRPAHSGSSPQAILHRPAS